jgi:putative transposase
MSKDFKNFMGQEYWHENTSVSLINYHFVWIVRRRRKMLVTEVDARLLELIPKAVEEIDCKVIAVETHLDHVHLFLQAKPILAPFQIMHKVKGYTSHTLRKEFPHLLKLPSLWTRSYFVGTAGSVSGDTIKRYVENQKTK